jgi:hypothetical protein
VIAIFLSNIPEGLSSAAGMQRAGRSAGYIFGVWGGIALVSGIAALAGYTLFQNFSADVIAATTAVAAGAILSMLADTMFPEAFEQAHDLAGLVTVAGFLLGRGQSREQESVDGQPLHTARLELQPLGTAKAFGAGRVCVCRACDRYIPVAVPVGTALWRLGAVLRRRQPDGSPLWEDALAWQQCTIPEA